MHDKCSGALFWVYLEVSLSSMPNSSGLSKSNITRDCSKSGHAGYPKLYLAPWIQTRE